MPLNWWQMIEKKKEKASPEDDAKATRRHRSLLKTRKDFTIRDFSQKFRISFREKKTMTIVVQVGQ